MTAKRGRKSKAEELGLPRLLERVVTDQKKLAVARRLLEIAEGDDPKAALKAIEILWGYMYGKPAQTVDLNAKVVTEYELVWSEDSGETPEAPSLTSDGEKPSGEIQGLVVRTALGEDTTGLLDVPGDSA